MIGIDYSWARPGAANIKAAGYDFICRYLSYDPGKNISASEAQDALNNGLGIILVWETTASRALSGRAGGIEDANEALRQANAVGQPNFLPIYFAVDFDASPAQQGAIDEYLRGAGTVLGPAYVGVYGGYWVVKRCLDNGSAKWAWQTYAWSGGNIDPRIHIYQYLNGGAFNGQADLNEAKQTNFGQWGIIQGGGAEMITDVNQATQIYKMLRPNGGASQAEIDGTVGKRTFAQFLNDAQAEIAQRDADLKKTIDQASQVPGLQQQVNDLTNQVNALKTTLKSANEQIGVLDSKLTVKNKEVVDLNTVIKAQGEQIVALQKQIGSGGTQPPTTYTIGQLLSMLLRRLFGGK